MNLDHHHHDGAHAASDMQGDEPPSAEAVFVGRLLVIAITAVWASWLVVVIGGFLEQV